MPAEVITAEEYAESWGKLDRILVVEIENRIDQGTRLHQRMNTIQEQLDNLDVQEFAGIYDRLAKLEADQPCRDLAADIRRDQRELLQDFAAFCNDVAKGQSGIIPNPQHYIDGFLQSREG